MMLRRIFYLPLLLLIVASFSFQRNDFGSKGEVLAQKWCSSCHLYVSPANFDRQHWEGQIFPRMALFMGLYPDSLARQTYAGTAPVFPLEPLLPQADFDAIRDFYLKSAPKSIKMPPKGTVANSLPGFVVRVPENKIIPPGTSMLRFGAGKEILLGDVYAKKLFVFSTEDFSLLRAGRIAEGIVDVEQTDSSLMLTMMGSFVPTDVPSGALLRIYPASGRGEVLQDSLFRPVQTAVGDLDGDGDVDYVVCEFGKYLGRLSWQEQTGDTLLRHILMDRPGAINAELKDTDGDGDLDITCLFGQADEGIWHFENQGRGKFSVQNLLRFNPANGSSSFQWCDFDLDGRLDILYTCGDNADFMPVLKPWHGVYIYLNQGKNRFKQHYFYPMNGAYKAELADFDGDGDLDLAAIAFFPDFNQTPAKGFVLLKNEGKKRFTAHTFPAVGMGRWMVMDKGDPDADGDIDLLLGAMTFDVPGNSDLVEAWKTAGIPFVLLENRSKN